MSFRASWIAPLAVAASAFAIVGAAWSTARAQTSVAEQQVLATDDRRTDALRRGDTGPLREIYLDDYTLVTPAGIVRSKAEQIAELESGELRYRSIEVLDRTVRVYGDVAVVISRDKYDILLRGQQPGGDLRFTGVYKKFGDAWRLIATHGSAIAR
jgi:ketosteroid isomerase-like protein